MGESKKNASIKKRYKVDTYGGTVQVEWENGGAVWSVPCELENYSASFRVTCPSDAFRFLSCNIASNSAGGKY